VVLVVGSKGGVAGGDPLRPKLNASGGRRQAGSKKNFPAHRLKEEVDNVFIALWAIARHIDRAQRQQYELIKYLNTAHKCLCFGDNLSKELTPWHILGKTLDGDGRTGPPRR
jgi:hypothetical protein